MGVRSEEEVITYDHFTQAYLKDFDWKVNILIGSNKMASMKETNLVLSLAIHKQGGDVHNVVVQLTKDELDHLISTMEKAQKTINHLQS